MSIIRIIGGKINSDLFRELRTAGLSAIEYAGSPEVFDNATFEGRLSEEELKRLKAKYKLQYIGVRD